MKSPLLGSLHDVQHDLVPDPIIQLPTDAIIKLTACAICGSDLHITDGPLGPDKS